jgi:hypothetical protein
MGGDLPMLKRLLALVLLATAALTASVTAPAQASTQGLVVVETKFYSDATLTVQVGYKLLDQCSGDVEFWGTSTTYKTQTRTSCTPQ